MLFGYFSVHIDIIFLAGMDVRIVAIEYLSTHQVVSLLVSNLVIIVPGCVSLILELDKPCKPFLQLWLFVLVLRLILRTSTQLYTMYYAETLSGHEQNSNSRTPQTSPRMCSPSRGQLMHEHERVVEMSARNDNSSEENKSDGTHEIIIAGDSSRMHVRMDSEDMSSASSQHPRQSTVTRHSSVQSASHITVAEVDSVDAVQNQSFHPIPLSNSEDTLQNNIIDHVDTTILFLQKFLDILDVLGVVWFALGNTLIFNSFVCMYISPMIFFVSLGYVIFGYVWFLLPLLMQCSLNYWPAANDTSRSVVHRRSLLTSSIFGIHNSLRSQHTHSNNNQSSHSNSVNDIRYNSGYRPVQSMWQPLDFLWQMFRDDNFDFDSEEESDSISETEASSTARSPRATRRHHIRRYWRNWLHHHGCTEFLSNSDTAMQFIRWQVTSQRDVPATDQQALQCAICLLSLCPSGYPVDHLDSQPAVSATEREANEQLVCFPCANRPSSGGLLVDDADATVNDILSNGDLEVGASSSNSITEPWRHVFHARCLHDWLQSLQRSGRSLRCPLCRSLPYILPTTENHDGLASRSSGNVP